MNETTLLNNWVIEEFAKNGLVNTISIVPTAEIDMNKENIRPLVNVDMRNSNIQEQVLVFAFTITVVQRRDTLPIKTDSKLLGNTNYLDNINETMSIAQRFINVLTGQNNTLNIEMETLGDIRILKLWNGSDLDGVQFDIELSIPNIGLSC
jgi:hypothetical protein